MSTRLTFTLSLTLWFVGASMSNAVETVRVDATSGAPRLLVDEKPVRARMFWGAPGTGAVRVAPEGTEILFEFSPHQDEPGNATMHFRFGQTAGGVDLDNIRVEDLTSGQDVLPVCSFESGQPDFSDQWHVWPFADKNTVGTVTVKPGRGMENSAGLHVSLQAPALGPHRVAARGVPEMSRPDM